MRSRSWTTSLRARIAVLEVLDDEAQLARAGEAYERAEQALANPRSALIGRGQRGLVHGPELDQPRRQVRNQPADVERGVADDGHQPLVGQLAENPAEGRRDRPVGHAAQRLVATGTADDHLARTRKPGFQLVQQMRYSDAKWPCNGHPCRLPSTRALQSGPQYGQLAFTTDERHRAEA